MLVFMTKLAIISKFPKSISTIKITSSRMSFFVKFDIFTKNLFTNFTINHFSTFSSKLAEYKFVKAAEAYSCCHFDLSENYFYHRIDFDVQSCIMIFYEQSGYLCNLPGIYTLDIGIFDPYNRIMGKSLWLLASVLANSYGTMVTQ